MHRLLVALLAMVDAVIAAGVGLMAVIAPIALLWAIHAVPGQMIWPLSGLIWQWSLLVPLHVQIPDEAAALLAVADEGTGFVLSLAPLLFTIGVFVMALRSGRRAARVDSGWWGIAGGMLSFSAIAVGVALTVSADFASTSLVQAIIFPSAVYLSGLVCGVLSISGAGGFGGFSGLRGIGSFARVMGSGAASRLISEGLRGIAVALTALAGAGALVVTVLTVLRGGEMVGLFQAAHTDAIGATVMTLLHLLYLPTMIIWAISWLAGPGFSVGIGGSVTPVGAHSGVLPGLPAFGLIPDQGSVWWLLVILIPIGAGALAGWVVRSRLEIFAPEIGSWPKALLALGISVGVALVAAVGSWLASGSIGPGRLAQVGPEPGPVALALGLEVLLGAAILLLAPAVPSAERPGASAPVD